MRVTHKMISTRTTGDLQEGLEGIQDAIDKVSTGRKIRSLSGEPSQLLSVMSLRKDFSINVQHISNNDKASFRLNQIDSVIGQVNDTMFLLKQFATDISSKIGNIEASAELNNMRSQFKQIANTKILNQYIFAGTKTSAPAFVEQNGKILYQGNTEKIELEIGPDEKMQVNMIGSEVFGSDDIGLFKVMETLSNLVDQKDLGIVDETTKHSISSSQLLTANGDLAATSTKLTDLAGIDVTDTILLSGQSSLPTGEGTVVNRTISLTDDLINNPLYGDTVGGFLQLLEDTYGDVKAYISSAGKIVVADNATDGENSSLRAVIEPQNENGLLDFGTMTHIRKTVKVQTSDVELKAYQFDADGVLASTTVAGSDNTLAELVADPTRQPRVGETLTISGTSPTGNNISKTFAFTAAPQTDANGDPVADANGTYGISIGATVEDLLSHIEFSFGGSIQAKIGVDGQLMVQDTVAGSSQTSIQVTTHNEGGGELYLGNFSVTTEGDDAPQELAERVKTDTKNLLNDLISKVDLIATESSLRIQSVTENETRLTTIRTTIEGQMKEVEGIDQATALTELRELENAYRSSLTVAGKAMQPSLIDILG